MRLFGEMCESVAADESCRNRSWDYEWLIKKMKKYDARQKCASVYSADLEDLLFSPVMIDFSENEN